MHHKYCKAMQVEQQFHPNPTCNFVICIKARHVIRTNKLERYQVIE